MTRSGVLAGLIVCGTLAIAAGELRGQTATVAELSKIGDRLYLLRGGGGNTAAFITDLGVVLVDTKLPGWGPSIMSKIRTITRKPVTTLINTHSHGDHTLSNEFFGTAVEIIAHENTRSNMERMPQFAGDKVHYLPKLLFQERMSIGAGRDKIELYYFGAAHTDGDAWVVFPALRVVHAGDMFPGKMTPIIDAGNGGSGLAYPDSLAKVAARLKNVDTIITGHGNLLTWHDLEEYARLTREFRDRVVDGFHHGLGVKDVAATWSLPERYKGYSNDDEQVESNVRAIFGELTR